MLFRSLDSVRVFAPGTQVVAQVDALKASLNATARTMQDTLMEHYSLYTGKKPMHPEVQPELEKEMQRKVPEVALGVREYLEKRREIRSPGLHQVMAYEVWNFVDGKRSYFEIYRAVRAEAHFAGSWYYGTVSAKQVADLLDAGVKAGILRLKP